jgi:hypothetical protein
MTVVALFSMYQGHEKDCGTNLAVLGVLFPYWAPEIIDGPSCLLPGKTEASGRDSSNVSTSLLLLNYTPGVQ